MEDSELLEKIEVYHDLSPYNTAVKTEKSVTFTANGNRGESYAAVGALQQDTVLEAEIQGQTKVGYPARAILKFRDKTADNSKQTESFLHREQPEPVRWRLL